MSRALSRPTTAGGPSPGFTSPGRAKPQPPYDDGMDIEGPEAGDLGASSVARSSCGGCRGQGAHRRWCPAVVGISAWKRGEDAARAGALGSGCNVPAAANHLWAAAAILTAEATQLADTWRTQHPEAPARDEPTSDGGEAAAPLT
jgi:hypothetical protein